MASYKEQSKGDWKNANGGPLSLDEIKVGCMQRIADATEVMARRYQDLLSERDRYERYYKEERERTKRLERRLRATRGALTRLKNKNA